MSRAVRCSGGCLLVAWRTRWSIAGMASCGPADRKACSAFYARVTKCTSSRIARTADDIPGDAHELTGEIPAASFAAREWAMRAYLSAHRDG